ncbi:MAG: Gldg family protein [Phycisphaerales bacterium]
MAVTDTKSKSKSSTDAPVAETAARRRVKYGVSLTVFILSVFVILVIVNWFAAETTARWDLTATRSYSISPQSMQIVESLEEPITISLVFAGQTASAYSQQVEDVLNEFTARSDEISVQNIDLTARSMAEYNALVDQLRTIFASEIEIWNETIESSRASVDHVRGFTATEAQTLETVINQLDPADQTRTTLSNVRRVLVGAPASLEMILERLGQFMEVDPQVGREFPDWDGAVSLLTSTTRDLESTFGQIAQIYRGTLESENPAPLAADYLAGAASRFEAEADALSSTLTRLNDLEPMKLAPILRALSTRNTVIMTSESNATVIEFEDLFPREQDTETGEARGDRRFAGERVIASAIRRLKMDQAPLAVFVSMASPPGTPGAAPTPDTSYVRRELEDFGFRVLDWNVATGPKPDLGVYSGEPVYIIMTPQPAQPGAPAGAMLAQRAQEMIDDGENVLIGLWPSYSAGFGQPDQWNEVLAPLGITADTARVIFERIPQPGNRDADVAELVVTDFNREHPVGRAIDGLPTVIAAAVPLEVSSSAATTDGEDDATPTAPIDHTVILDIEPTERIWADSEWMTGQLSPPETPDTEPYPVVVAVERPVDAGSQRAIVAGSGGWFASQLLAQMQIDMELGSLSLAYPGNLELFTASVLWLAQLDEMIAPGPASRARPRIAGLSDGARTAWGWLLIAGLPLFSLTLGVVVWFSRRG